MSHLYCPPGIRWGTTPQLTKVRQRKWTTSQLTPPPLQTQTLMMILTTHRSRQCPKRRPLIVCETFASIVLKKNTICDGMTFKKTIVAKPIKQTKQLTMTNFSKRNESLFFRIFFSAFFFGNHLFQFRQCHCIKFKAHLELININQTPELFFFYYYYFLYIHLINNTLYIK